MLLVVVEFVVYYVCVCVCVCVYIYIYIYIYIIYIFRDNIYIYISFIYFRDGSRFSNIQLVDLFIEYRLGCAIYICLKIPHVSGADAVEQR